MDTIYCLIDGENIDATLGVNILKRFPRGEERPRWDRVLHFNPWSENATESEDVTTAIPQVEAQSTAQINTPLAAAQSANTAHALDTEHPPTHVTPAIFAHDHHEALQANQTHHTENSEHLKAHTDYTLTAADSDAQTEPNTDTHGLFFLNASQRVAKSFVQALLAIGWQPILLTSENPELKIVDMGIQKTIEAIVKEKPGAKVVIASHDVDYLPQIEMLLDAGHDVAVLCFREYLSISLAQLEERGLKIMDLEYDVDAFTIPLSRVSTIDIADYNPYDFI